MPSFAIRDLATRPIKPGEHSPRVVDLRALLRSKGFEISQGDEHGIAERYPPGKGLHTAVQVAQLWCGLAPTGDVDDITWRRVAARRPILAKKLASLRGHARWRPRVVDCRDGRNGYPVHPSRNWSVRPLGAIRFLIGHYTGGPASFHNDALFHVRSSYLSRGGAPRIAYHLGVDYDGTILVFNDPEDWTWHCGWNHATVGIVFRGSSEGPTAAQKRSLRWLIPKLEQGTFGYDYPPVELGSTHRHVNTTSCPGELGEAFYRATFRRWVDNPKAAA